MIVIESKRRKRENILKEYPNVVIADVTSQATDGLVRLSPFYPHGGIHVPFSEGYTEIYLSFENNNRFSLWYVKVLVLLKH